MALTERFEKAVVYACVVHAGQTRKGTSIPYVSHLLGVASLALEYGADEEVAIAALLHDAIEDAGGKEREADLRSRFGDRVAKIVRGCTDADTTPKPPWRKRKEDYIAHLAGADSETLLVSCCDKLHNARAIVAELRVLGESLWSKFNGGREGTLWYYRALVDEFRKQALRPSLVDELDRVVTVMEELALPKRDGT